MNSAGTAAACRVDAQPRSCSNEVRNIEPSGLVSPASNPKASSSCGSWGGLVKAQSGDQQHQGHQPLEPHRGQIKPSSQEGGGQPRQQWPEVAPAQVAGQPELQGSQGGDFLPSKEAAIHQRTSGSSPSARLVRTGVFASVEAATAIGVGDC